MGIKKAYIAGRITGDPEYRAKFAKAEGYLKSQGYAVMSPAIMPDGFDYDDYMQICRAMLMVCHAAFFLPDWLDSPGAKREFEWARDSGKDIKQLTWAEIDLHDYAGGVG